MSITDAFIKFLINNKLSYATEHVFYQNFILVTFRVYSILHILSCILLVLTIVVYTYYPNLLTKYSKLMRHYSLMLFFSFLFLAVQNQIAENHMTIGFCKITGKTSYYIIMGINNVHHNDTYNSIKIIFQC